MSARTDECVDQTARNRSWELLLLGIWLLCWAVYFTARADKAIRARLTALESKPCLMSGAHDRHSDDADH